MSPNSVPATHRHRCMRCDEEFDCRTPTICVANYDVMPLIFEQRETGEIVRSDHCPAQPTWDWIRARIERERLRSAFLVVDAPSASPPSDGTTTPPPSTGIPRRIDGLRWVPAERAIQDAVDAVEAMGAADRLTDAVSLLSKARDAVADACGRRTLAEPSSATRGLAVTVTGAPRPIPVARATRVV